MKFYEEPEEATPAADWKPVVSDYITEVSTTLNVPKLIAHNIELGNQLKSVEEKLGAMKSARVAEIVPMVTEWRRLVLRAQFERR